MNGLIKSDRFDVGLAAQRAAASSRSLYHAFVPFGLRWNDVDAFGHVNNAEFYAWFDTTVLTYLNTIDEIGTAASPIAVLVVESCAQFHAEVVFSDKVEIGLAVERIGRSSVRYRLGVFRNAETESAVDGAFTHVFVDNASRRPVAIPDQFRTRFQTLSPKGQAVCAN